MADRQHAEPCCLFESAEQVEAEPDLYDCDRCPVLAYREQMWPENRQALEVFRAVCTRLAGDGHAMGPVLQRFTAHLSDEDFQDLWWRLNVLYNVLCPPKSKD